MRPTSKRVSAEGLGDDGLSCIEIDRKTHMEKVRDIGHDPRHQRQDETSKSVAVGTRLEGLGDVLTVREAAGVLRLSVNSAYEAVRRGEIPSVRIGRRVLVPKASLARLLGISEGGTSTAQAHSEPTQGDVGDAMA